MVETNFDDYARDVFVPPGKGGRWPWANGISIALGLLLLLCIVAATCWWAVSHVESRLESNIRTELQSSGIEAERLEFEWDYRNLSVTGLIDKDATEDQLLAVIREADGNGVRQINLSLDEVSEEFVDTSLYGAVDVTAMLEDGVILLQGTVLTNEQRDQLQSAAEQALGVGGVTNEIVVSGLQEQTPGSDERVASLANSIAGLNEAVSADARLSATDFRFNATVDDKSQADDLIELQGSAGDVGLVISGDIVTRKSNPDGVIDVVARKDNGRVLLSGTVTSETHKQTLLNAAQRTFDEQSVIDEIVVMEAASAGQAARSIGVLASAISYFDVALEADAKLSSDQFEFNAQLEFEEDAGPLLAVGENARSQGLNATGSIEARQMSLSKEVSMLQSEIDTLAAELQENVVFDSGKAELGFDAKQTLDKVVDAMNRFQRPVVEVGGHTDNAGAEDANQKLSLFRATAVLEYMKLSGIDSLRVRAIGFGESRPLASNSTEIGRKQNRRVEFTALANLNFDCPWYCILVQYFFNR